MNQLEFAQAGLGLNQTDRLIEHLKGRHGEWVGLPTLVDVVGGYAIHSRAADARKRGYEVEQKSIVEPVTRKVFSYYRIP